MAYFAASIDPIKKNTEFARSLELDYPILSDEDKSVARAFGVLKAMGLYAARHTIYIGSDGKILFIDTEVSPATAGKDLVAHLKELGIPKRQ